MRVGDAGGVCGLERAANLSMSDSSWGLRWDVLAASLPEDEVEGRDKRFERIEWSRHLRISGSLARSMSITLKRDQQVLNVK